VYSHIAWIAQPWQKGGIIEKFGLPGVKKGVPGPVDEQQALPEMPG